MQIKIPDNLTDDARQIINVAIRELANQGALEEIVKQTLWDRFIDWWYTFWRSVGFN